MTRKLLNLSKIALLVFSISFLLGSCTKEYYTNDVYIDNPTQWYVNQFTVKSSEWQWDKDAKLYFADKNLPDLTLDIYEDGAIIGYVYLGEMGKNEIMSTLPYRSESAVFERFWFDVTYDLNKQVRFYYQWSDYAQIRPSDHNFKITMLY